MIKIYLSNPGQISFTVLTSMTSGMHKTKFNVETFSDWYT